MIKYFDIETIPDVSKRALWDTSSRAEAHDADILLAISGTGRDALEYASGLGRLSLIKMAELEAESKNRSTVLKGIDSELKKVSLATKNASLTPEYNRIVAIGSAIGDGDIDVTLSDGTEESERNMLEIFWRFVGRSGKLCGYNISGFDLRVLLVRSALLGVNPSGVYLPEFMKRFSSRVIDIMHVRFPFSKAMGLKELAIASGINPLVEEVDGSMVAELFAKDKKLLSEYCKSDVHLVRELEKLYRGYLHA